MLYLMIVIVVVLVVLAALRYPAFKRNRLSRDAQESAAPKRTPATPTPAQTELRRPPGTADLDDVDAIRPDIDAGSMASARMVISSAVPDGVLADALLDATPEELEHLFASVPKEVMDAAMGKDNVQHAPLNAEDLAQLSGFSNSVDDLEIWSFADSDKK